MGGCPSTNHENSEMDTVRGEPVEPPFDQLRANGMNLFSEQSIPQWGEMTNIYESGLEPAQFLVENIGLLPKGRALDVAMGSGRNTIYLAEMGFEVEGVDISPEKVNDALELARKASVFIRAQIADLESNYHIEEGAYDLIICFNYLQRSLIRQIKDGLRRGGMVVYETFIVDQVQFGKPKNPDYLLKHNELLDIFRDFRCLRYREGIIDGQKAIASIIAQKV